MGSKLLIYTRARVGRKRAEDPKTPEEARPDVAEDPRRDVVEEMLATMGGLDCAGYVDRRRGMVEANGLDLYLFRWGAAPGKGDREKKKKGEKN